jgi:hypothetical protein
MHTRSSSRRSPKDERRKRISVDCQWQSLDRNRRTDETGDQIADFESAVKIPPRWLVSGRNRRSFGRPRPRSVSTWFGDVSDYPPTRESFGTEVAFTIVEIRYFVPTRTLKFEKVIEGGVPRQRVIWPGAPTRGEEAYDKADLIECPAGGTHPQRQRRL